MLLSKLHTKKSEIVKGEKMGLEIGFIPGNLFSKNEKDSHYLVIKRERNGESSLVRRAGTETTYV